MLGTPEMQKFFRAEGASAVGGSPEQFAASLRAEMGKWEKVIKAAGLKRL